MKKIIAMLLAIAILAAMAAGCGNSAAAPTEQANEAATEGAQQEAAAPTEKAKITVSIYDRGRVPASEGTYEDNRWTRWIDENSDFDVDWVPVNRKEFAQQMNVLLASDTAPDIICSYDRSYMQTLADQELIMPVGELVEKYSTDYKAFHAEHPETIPYVTLNGEEYLLTCEKESRHNHALWIRQDWLDKLNLEMPQTTDELLDVMRAFRDADIDGNGVNDTVPFTSKIMLKSPSIEEIFMCDLPWFVQDGKVHNNHLCDRYQSYLEFKKTMFEEKLMDPEYITDADASRANQLWSSGKSGVYMGQWQAPTSTLLDNEPDANVVPLETPATEYGRNGLHTEPNVGLYVAINAKAANPEACIKFCDWMLTDGWHTIYYGNEGEHFNYVDGVEIMVQDEKLLEQLQYTQEYPFLKQQHITPETLRAEASQMTGKFAIMREEEAQAMEVLKRNTHRQDIPYSILPTDQAVKDFMLEWEPLAKEIETAVVMGSVQGKPMTAEEGMQELQKAWDRLGGDEILEIVQQWYDANKANFQ